MARKITIIGKNAQYIERRGANATPDNDREIMLEGEDARYEEYSGVQAAHFPLNKSEEDGKRLYELLIREQFIARDTEMDCWLYRMGFSVRQPAEVKPIAWLKNVQLAQEMLRGVHGNLLLSKELSVSGMNELAEQCFTKDGKPLKLAKFKAEVSWDSDILKNFGSSDISSDTAVM